MARRDPTPPAPAPAVNEALRAHVTSAKFVLTLGGTQIAALVWLDAELARDRSMDEDLADGTVADGNHYPEPSHPLRRAFRNNMTGVAGCIARGLVLHHHPAPTPGKWAGHLKPTQIWTITAAGQAVITLLKEAGIWAEYAAAIPAAFRAQPRGRRAA